MPVEVTRIKGRFKELFKADLSTKRLDEITARLNKKLADDAEDSAIDLILNDANDVYPFDDMVKDEHRLVAAENKAKAKPAPAPADTTTPPAAIPPVPPADDVPSWAKTLMDDIKGMKEGKVTESKTQAARTEFDKNETFKALTEKGGNFYFGQIDVNSDTPVAEQISNLEEIHKENLQSRADGVPATGKPPVSKAGDAANKEMIAAAVG
jgi:hypothetical protein